MTTSALSGRRLARRCGWFGFWFFLAKGLLWLLVPAAAALLAI